MKRLFINWCQALFIVCCKSYLISFQALDLLGSLMISRPFSTHCLLTSMLSSKVLTVLNPAIGYYRALWMDHELLTRIRGISMWVGPNSDDQLNCITWIEWFCNIKLSYNPLRLNFQQFIIYTNPNLEFQWKVTIQNIPFTFMWEWWIMYCHGTDFHYMINTINLSNSKFGILMHSPLTVCRKKYATGKIVLYMYILH